MLVCIAGDLWNRKNVKAFLTAAANAITSLQREERKQAEALFQKWAGFNPHEGIPRIESLSRLTTLQKACHRLSYKDASDRTVSFHPTFFQRGVKKPHRGDSRPRSVAYIKSMLAGQCRRRVLLKTIHGLCLRCDKLVISNGGMKGKPPRVHAKCLYDYQREYGSYAKLSELADRRKRGGQVTRENLQKHWTWTIRHKLGNESLSTLAMEFGVIKSTVADGIKFIMAHLPEPELVPERLRTRVLLLLDAHSGFSRTRLAEKQFSL